MRLRVKQPLRRDNGLVHCDVQLRCVLNQEGFTDGGLVTRLSFWSIIKT
jgi:hypothetical protein